MGERSWLLGHWSRYVASEDIQTVPITTTTTTTTTTPKTHQSSAVHLDVSINIQSKTELIPTDSAKPLARISSEKPAALP